MGPPGTHGLEDVRRIRKRRLSLVRALPSIVTTAAPCGGPVVTGSLARATEALRSLTTRDISVPSRSAPPLAAYRTARKMIIECRGWRNSETGLLFGEIRRVTQVPHQSEVDGSWTDRKGGEIMTQECMDMIACA